MLKSLTNTADYRYLTTRRDSVRLVTTIDSPQGCRVRIMPAPCGTRVKADDTPSKTSGYANTLVGHACGLACLFITYSNSVSWPETWFRRTAHLPSDRRSQVLLRFLKAFGMSTVRTVGNQTDSSQVINHASRATATYNLASNFFSESPKA